MIEIFAAIVNGATWGFIVALLALGLVLIFGFLHIMNLAHGSLYMVAAVLTFYATTRLQSFAWAIVLVPPLIAAAGVGVERWLLRPVGKIRNSDVMVTFGLAMIMEYVVLIVFGGAPQRIPYPVDVFLPMPGGRYPLYRIVVAAVSAICLTVVGLVLKRTAFGLYIRAAHQDFELARALGIPVSRVLMLTFGAGCACAALAGIMTAPLVGVEFRMGVDIMAVSFLVTILGGLTRIHAIALVALASGISENLLAIVLEPILARGVLLVALLSALIIMYARRGSDRIV